MAFLIRPNFVALIVALPSLFLQSCDCIQVLEGDVIDKVTSQPVANVQLINREKFQRGQVEDATDSTGHFLIERITGGIFRCSNWKIEFRKEGYKSRVVKNPENKVFLKPGEKM